jgi:hypothetical protein
MKVGILGSGFGLYGYLPSIVKLNWTPLVLQKSYNAIILRPELNRFAESVLMFNEVSEMIEESDNLVVATPPVNQQRILEGLIPFSGHLFLEKPLAADINSHAELIQQLDVSSQDFSVAYLLKYTKQQFFVVKRNVFLACLLMEKLRWGRLTTIAWVLLLLM